MPSTFRTRKSSLVSSKRRRRVQGLTRYRRPTDDRVLLSFSIGSHRQRRGRAEWHRHGSRPRSSSQTCEVRIGSAAPPDRRHGSGLAESPFMALSGRAGCLELRPLSVSKRTRREACFMSARPSSGGCDLPMNLPPNANARVPNVIKNPTCREMRETLPKGPEVFKYKIHKLRARQKINGSEPRTNCSPPVG